MVEKVWHRIFIAKSSTAKLAPLRLFNVLNGLRPIRKKAARADEINKIVASKKSDEHRPMALAREKPRLVNGLALASISTDAIHRNIGSDAVRWRSMIFVARPHLRPPRFARHPSSCGKPAPVRCGLPLATGDP